jgi:ATP-dependent helicase/nuclease subunit A
VHFNPINIHVEYPIHYTNDSGQIISGCIDPLLETAEVYVVVDHKASPRARPDWEEIELGYSRQLGAYKDRIRRATREQVFIGSIPYGVASGLGRIRIFVQASIE